MHLLHYNLSAAANCCREGCLQLCPWTSSSIQPGGQSRWTTLSPWGGLLLKEPFEHRPVPTCGSQAVGARAPWEPGLDAQCCELYWQDGGMIACRLFQKLLIVLAECFCCADQQYSHLQMLRLDVIALSVTLEA